MKTNLLYLKNPQQKQSQVKIIGIDSRQNTTVVTFNKTIFYPISGGQPADKGQIIGPNGQL